MLLIHRNFSLLTRLHFHGFPSTAYVAICDRSDRMTRLAVAVAGCACRKFAFVNLPSKGTYRNGETLYRVCTLHRALL